MARRKSKPRPPAADLVKSYLDFLIEHRGLSDSSRRQNRKALGEFLAHLKRHGRSIWELSVTDLDGFVEATAELGFSKVHMSIRTCSLRGFLRYLFAEGWLTEDLSSLVESPRIYREARVPRHFTWVELEKLIASVQGDTEAALRDRALLVLLCVYGLRSEEVSRLSLDDLDWRHSVLRIGRRKMGVPLVLPLVPVAKEVLGLYIRRGRPEVPHRELLLTNRRRPFLNGMEVTNRLHVLVKAAGLQGGRGVHAIRRAVGTRLVEQGLGLTEVACLLGHSNPDSSRVYLRLSLEFLRDVADNYAELL